MNTPLLVEPVTVEENYGGLWFWFQTSPYGRRKGFRIEWEVQDPTTTTGAPTPPTKKPPKGK